MTRTETSSALLAALGGLAREAGAVIMAIYATDFAVQGKADASPVTEADQRAEAVILAGLAALAPDIPVVAEEAVAAGHIPEVGERFWLVDPLDGTKEFIQRNGEFTVNIALIEHGLPVLGVVLAPALGPQGRLWAGAWAWVPRCRMNQASAAWLAARCRPMA
jgi:3'(2'), 5'-bisphosphate nucleotidase